MAFETDDPQSDPYAHLIPGAKKDSTPQGDDPYAHLIAKKDVKKPDQVGFGEALARGLSRPFMGLQDVVEGLVAKARGGSYTEGRSEAKVRNATAATESPWTTVAGELAGNAAQLPFWLASAPGKAAAALGEAAPEAAQGIKAFLGRHVVQPAAKGAMIGTAAGAVNSDNPSVWGRIQSAPYSAPVGAAFGPLAHAAATGGVRGAMAADNAAAGATGGKVGMPYSFDEQQSMGQAGKTNRAIAKGVSTEAGAPSLQTYSDRLRQQDNGGQILPDLSKAARVMAGEAGTAQDPRSDAFRTQVKTRDRAAPDRIRSTIEAMGPARDPRAEVQAAAKFRGDENGFDQTYKMDDAALRQAGEEPVGANPTVQAFLNTPAGRSLFRASQLQAANEPRKLPTIKTTHEEPTGPKTLMADEVVNAPPASEPKFKNELIQAIIDKAETPERKAQLIADMRAQGVPELPVAQPPVPKSPIREVTSKTPVLDVKGLHYLIQKAERRVASGLDENRNELLTQDAMDTKRFLEGIKSDAVPIGLRSQMERYAGISRHMDAEKLGLGFRPYSTVQGPQGVTPDLAKGEGVERDTHGVLTGLHGLEAAAGTMGPERGGFQAGMRQTLKDEMGAVDRGQPNVGQRALGSFPQNEETDRWMQLLGSDKQTGPLKAALSRERNMAATNRMIPEYGTKEQRTPAGEAANAMSYGHSVSPSYIAGRGMMGMVRKLYRPQEGSLAEALSKPAEEALSNALSGARGLQSIRGMTNQASRGTLLAALAQYYR